MQVNAVRIRHAYDVWKDSVAAGSESVTAEDAVVRRYGLNSAEQKRLRSMILDDEDDT